jgi:hypothetical protein
LAFGIFWGVIPFITVLFVFRGENDSILDVTAAVFDSLTILPACILAFWHRRLACVWLSLNAALIIAITIPFLLRTRRHDLWTIICVLVPVLIAFWIDFMESNDWPDAVNSKIRSEFPGQ